MGLSQIKNFSSYLVAPILTLIIFSIIFQIWEIDFTQPIFGRYRYDTLLHAFLVKNVIDSGWFFSNDLVGLPHLTDKFYLYDFPLQGSSFNFLIFKFFSYFSSNPFLVLNLHFLLTFLLISATSFAVLRHFKISFFSATLVSILYSFLYYHFHRGTSHALLSNYASIPLVVMVAVWIMSKKIELIQVNKKNQFCIKPNKFFIFAAIIGIFTATNDVYYAFFALIVFCISWFLESLKSGKFFSRNFCSTIVLCLVVIVTLLCLYIPSFAYWIANGPNRFVTNRNLSQSELYALTIIDLLLPTYDHYIKYFADLKSSFGFMVYERSRDFGNERDSESLGLLGSAGFLFLIIWVIASSISNGGIFLQKTINRFSIKKDEQFLISDLANLNLLLVLFSAVGGLIMFIAMPFSLIRSYARVCIIIAFISFVIVAIFFDKILSSKFFGKRIHAAIFLSFISLLAVFDQVGQSPSALDDPKKFQQKFISDKNFVEQIEAEMPKNSQIFVMPISTFPEGDDYENLVGYLHSKSLRWSYPAIAGRESDLWQKKVAKLGFENFLSEIKKIGFNGVLINRASLAEDLSMKKHNRSEQDPSDIGDWRGVIEFEKKLSKTAKLKITSSDVNLVFYKL